MGRLEDTRNPRDDLNGNGYFYMGLCWTGVGLQANFDEENVLLCAMLLLLCWFEATGPTIFLQRNPRFRATVRDLHEVLLS